MCVILKFVPSKSSGKPRKCKSCFSNHALVETIFEGAFKRSVFEAWRFVSTKTLLLKHYDRRQGKGGLLQGITCEIRNLGKMILLFVA